MKLIHGNQAANLAETDLHSLLLYAYVFYIKGLNSALLHSIEIDVFSIERACRILAATQCHNPARAIAQCEHLSKLVAVLLVCCAILCAFRTLHCAEVSGSSFTSSPQTRSSPLPTWLAANTVQAVPLPFLPRYCTD